MEHYSRTVKLLLSIAKGVDIVRKGWLVDSEYFKKSVPFDQYWLEYPGDKWLIKNAVEKVKKGHKVFDNMKFMLPSPTSDLNIKLDNL